MTKNIWCVLGSQFQLLFTYKTRTLNFTSSVATLFKRARKRLNCCIANLFRTMCTKFYQNQLAFVEDMTKMFWCVFIGSQCIISSFDKCSYSARQQFSYSARRYNFVDLVETLKKSLPCDFSAHKIQFR